MRTFLVYQPDPHFPAYWIHIATVMECDETSAVETARRLPGLRYASLRVAQVR
jgi:hypothetical protein